MQTKKTPFFPLFPSSVTAALRLKTGKKPSLFFTTEPAKIDYLFGGKPFIQKLRICEIEEGRRENSR